MGKFEKASGVPDLELLELDDAHAVSSDSSAGDPLRFQVATSDRRFFTVNLTRFRDGDAERDLMGFPELIVQLLPIIRNHLGQNQRTKKGIEGWLSRSIVPLFKYVSNIKRNTGIAPNKLEEFEDYDGVLLKSYLLTTQVDPRFRKKRYVAIQTLLKKARDKSLPILRWPSFVISPTRDVHSDVDPLAVKACYNTCKRILEEAEREYKNGQALLAEGGDPRDFGSNRLFQVGRRGSLINPGWHSHANQTFLMRKIIRDRIVGDSQVDDITINKLRRLTGRLSTNELAGWDQITNSIAPSSLEVLAAITVVSMETGWIDEVSGIDLTRQWYALRRGDNGEALRKTDSVVIYSTRPKTSKPVSAIGLAGSHFRSFQVIRGLETRSAFLRECLLERRALLAKGELNSLVRSDIAEIDRRLRSPWLYYNSKATGTEAVGIGPGQLFHYRFIYFKKLTIDSLNSSKRSDLNLVTGINSLKWSDFRDAFATHIYDNSGGNIFLVKRALNHNHIQTSRHYLRQRRQIRQRFDAFRKVMEVALTEAKQNRPVDPTILFLASNYDDFGDGDRERLKAFRTRVGMGCADPTSPDTHLAPKHTKGALCAVQRCILCRHGIVFTCSHEGLADRHADLMWLRSKLRPDRWLTSTLSWEFEAIELVRDNIFDDFAELFNKRSSERLNEIVAGRAFVFDDPESVGWAY